MLVWVRMKRAATDMHKTIYRVKYDLLYEYLVQELRSPRVAFA